jgi:hypothetical protein
MKTVLFEQKKIYYELHDFVESKTKIMQHVYKMQQISLLPKYI